MSGLNLKIHNQKPTRAFKIMVLGHNSVGKSAIVVRFITRRFIGEYDSSERIYKYENAVIDNESQVNFEILDSAGLKNQENSHENECLINQMETNIRWADAFILVYSVTDKCSFEEVNRLKFLINYNKRRRKIHNNNKDDCMDVPVILVANKIDQTNDRMITKDEGQRRCQEIGCACFHEISARESVDDVRAVFRDACQFLRIFSKFPKLLRSKSDSIRLSMSIHSDVEMILSPDKILSLCCDPHDEKRRPILLFRRTRSSWNEGNEEHDEFDELETAGAAQNEPFRSRAKTDGNLLLSRTKKWKILSPLISPPQSHNSSNCTNYRSVNVNRRNSISLRGNHTTAVGHVSY